MIAIDITNRQSAVLVDKLRLRKALRAVLQDKGLNEVRLSVAVVDDPTITRLNERFLNHEGPADVLSFLLEESEGGLEGEVIVSGDTAARIAPRYGWSGEEELLLYAVHGALHLVGYDDATPRQRTAMRRREQAVLASCGLEARYRNGGGRRTPGAGTAEKRRTNRRRPAVAASQGKPRRRSS